MDPILDEYDEEEVGLVLSLGLLCSHPHPEYKSSMRRIVQFFMKDAGLPTLPSDVHMEFPKMMMEYSDSFPDDSDHIVE